MVPNARIHYIRPMSWIDQHPDMAGAFEAVDPPLTGLRVALVDDVLTTGATLGSATTALARLEPASVGAVTFARALVPA